MLDRAKFYGSARNGPFPPKLTKSLVQGTDLIFDDWERRGLTFLPHLAYALATVLHETAATMQPVIETRNSRDTENPSVEKAIARLDASWRRGSMPWVKTAYWKKDAKGLSWLGRGPVQCTHKRNYARAEKETGVPFTQNPDLMLIAAHAMPTLLPSMLEGWWTGKKLSDFLTPAKLDWHNSRRIINGVESAEKVAGYAKLFLADLVSASDQVSVA